MEYPLPFDLNSLTLPDLKGLVDEAYKKRDPIYDRIKSIYWIRERETKLSQQAIETLKKNSRTFSRDSLQALIVSADQSSPKFIRTATHGIFFPYDEFQHIDYAYANGLWEPVDAGFLSANQRLGLITPLGDSMSLGITRDNPQRPKTQDMLRAILQNS